MSTRIWAQLAICPWDDTRQDTGFADLVEAITSYGFEEDEILAGKNGMAIRRLADSQARYGVAAFEEMISLAAKARLWCLDEDEGGYEWAGSRTVRAPDGRAWWTIQTGDGGGAVDASLACDGDLDLLLSGAAFAPEHLGLWVVSDGPPVGGHDVSRRVAANCLARLGVEDGADERIWEAALRLASRSPVNESALPALAANPAVPERLRVAAALVAGAS